MAIETLIDKQDNFETIRDQVAGILVLESAAQMELAALAGKDPALWNLEVYAERANPFEKWLDSECCDKDPIVNIWYNDSNFNKDRSDTHYRQHVTGSINIDCFGAGLAYDDPDGGHFPGDMTAAYEAHRAARLVRNILMAAEYRYLGMRGTVWGRWVRNVQIFQPAFDAQNVHKVVGARLTLEVEYNEFSPQYVAGNVLEYVAIEIFKQSDGRVQLLADYDYTQEG
jgi:hypothetical protein